jgi:type II secretory pathway component PulC
MRRTWVLVMVLVWAAGARADEGLLETMSVEELLGEAPLGLSVEGAQLWSGTLGALVEAVTALGEEVQLETGADPDTSVTMVCNAPVPASLARAAVGAACKRLGAAEEGEDLRDLQVMITVVDADQVTAMAALHRKMNLVGAGAVVEEVPDDSAVIVVNTDKDMDLPPDPAALFDAMFRQPAQPVPAEGVEELEDDHYRVQRSVLVPLLHDAARMARMVPSYHDGELQGFKVFSIRPGSVYAALRIRNGDVLLRVDAEPIHNLLGVETLTRALLTRTEVALTVTRRGHEKVLRYQVTGDPVEIPELWSLGPPTREHYMERLGVTEDGDVLVLPRGYVLGLRETLAEDIHWRYAQDEAGAVVGMRGRASGGNLLHMLDLRRGESLAAVDGAPITTPAGLMGLFTALRTQSEVTIETGHRDGSRVLQVRIDGEPDVDTAPWPLPLLDIAPTMDQTRAALGIVETDGVLTVPREVVAELLDPLAEIRMTPTPVEAPVGYRLMYGDRIDRLAPLGLNMRDTVVALDGEPVTTRGMAESIVTRLLEAEAVTLTVRRRGRDDLPVALVLVGEPLDRPTWRDELQIEPTLDERRSAAGITVEGDTITLPRSLVAEEGFDVLRWLPVESGETFDGYGVPRRSRAWLTAFMGLRADDVVVSFDDRDLDSTEARDALLDALLKAEEVTLVVLRGTQRLDLRIRVQGEPAERPESWSPGRRRPKR